MKRIISITFFSLTVILANAQGIQFVQGLSWDQVKTKAKAENKYIFVDCYATWCGPCKYMAETIFPQKEVGDYMNEHFVSVAFQMDRTANDNEAIRQQYGDAGSLNSQYGIGAFPTYLFFTSDGQAIHRFIGGTGKDPAAFIARAQDAFDPGKQYYTVKEKWKDHLGDSAYLLNALKGAIEIGDFAKMGDLTDPFIGCLKDPYAKENLKLIAMIAGAVPSSKSKGFQMILKQPLKVNEILGYKRMDKDFAESIIRHTAFAEDVYPLLQDPTHEPDWKKIGKDLRKKYPTQAERVVMESKTGYYARTKQFDKYGPALVAFMNKYGDHLGNYDINNNAWFMFKDCNDRKCLLEALKWSKRTIGGTPIPYDSYDTYANLLYKTGNKEEAIAWEMKALAAVEALKRPDKVKEFTDVVQKMRNGEKTWK